MGLAASQARFLAITSRKMNCEFQSMQIAQDKLSVTRDLQKASQEYQKSLTATKLVWDCDTVDNDIYDLTYDLMMNPSAINEYDAYLITDAQGKIVLSEKMFNAALAAHVINENGDPVAAGAFSEEGRNKFLTQLGVQGIVESTVINSIKDLGSDGYTQSGVGGEIVDKTLSYIMNTTAFINYMKTSKDDDDKLIYGFNLNGTHKQKVGEGENAKEQDVKDFDKISNLLNKNSLVFDKNDPDGSCILAKGESGISSSSEIENLTLGDIISGKYTLSIKSGDFNKISEISKQILENMAKTLGYNNETVNGKGLNVTEQAHKALNQAFDFTMDLINSQTDKVDGSNNVKENVNKAHTVNTIVKGDNTCTISISNLLNSFLTNFVIALEGYDCGLNIKKDSAKDSNYVTKYLDYNFQLKNEEGMTERDTLNADFYNQLYNQLCMNGASTDATKRELVMDKAYLANALKNGQLFVSTLNTDGYFYQGHYTASGHIAEVTDEDAIAQAEAEYNVTKTKLNYKEETLEIQMKNLDTEISSLTTEYDTVKGLISKSVEKVFTMFSS